MLDRSADKILRKRIRVRVVEIVISPPAAQLRLKSRKPLLRDERHRKRLDALAYRKRKAKHQLVLRITLSRRIIDFLDVEGLLPPRFDKRGDYSKATIEAALTRYLERK